MSAQTNPEPRRLLAAPVGVSSTEFSEIQSWPFSDEPFFVRQVRTMLLRDIPQMAVFGDCSIWRYLDPIENNATVGFGTIALSGVHSRYTNGKLHPYIPLISVRPGIQSYGYGQFIVEHLVGEAAILARAHREDVADCVFLDVYAANVRAYALYENKCQFVNLNPSEPVLDPDEANEAYFIMARRVA